jgi:CDP-diacylglycerol--glycerol-3-phosphate 3-phosphatidyltransferase
MNGLPLALTALCAALAPVVVLLALWLPPARAAFGLCLVLAFFSDVFDGILARRLGVATATLRRLDSIADTVFYVAATFAVWTLHPSALRERWLPLAGLVVLEAARYAFDLLKFGREASYHMWSSKLWGVALFAGFFSLLALGADNALVDAAVWVGLAADLEGLAISVVMRSWRSDVPSVVHAIRLRHSE